MDPIIQKAKEDLAEVKAQIAPLLAKQRKLEAFLAIYESEEQLELGMKRRSVEEFLLGRQSRENTARATITNAVATILADGTPRHTRELISLLRSQNIEVGGADKVLSLSALLSRDDRFLASRAVGWSLKK